MLKLVLRTMLVSLERGVLEVSNSGDCYGSGCVESMLFILSDAQLEAGVPKNENLSGLLHLKKASILLIDDVSLLQNATLQPARPSHRVVLDLRVSD